MVAVDVADARLQLARMGYTDIRVLTDNLMGHLGPDTDNQAQTLVYIEARHDSLPAALLKMYRGNAIFWLPGALVLGYAFWSGSSTVTGSVLFTLGLLYTTYRTLPAVLYKQLLGARVAGRTAAGLRYVSLMRMLANKDHFSPMMADAEQAKLMAMDGHLAQAVELFSTHQGRDDRIAYLVQLNAIYDHAGDHDKAIAVHRETLEASQGKAEVKIDLAWSLLRRSGR